MLRIVEGNDVTVFDLFAQHSIVGEGAIRPS